MPFFLSPPCFSARPPFAHFSARPPFAHLKPLAATATPTRYEWADALEQFEWSDALRFGSAGDVEPSDLSGFFKKIHLCNYGSEDKGSFMPFVIDNKIAGYTHKGFSESLKKFQDIFTILEDKNEKQITLNSSINSYEERTEAMAYVVKCLGDIIPNIRNELYPVTSEYGVPPFFSLERAAAPYFGTKAYGVHINGYVEKNGEKYIWVGKRSNTENSYCYPGMLDHIVAGGLPYGISRKENMMKECEEEAGIPSYISNNVVPVGAVSHMSIGGYRYTRDVLFCYDLKLPIDFIPKNKDGGEVESFRLIPVSQAANIVKRTFFYKPNCALVIIDFLLRHKYIDPDCKGYLNLLQSLRSGDCS